MAAYGINNLMTMLAGTGLAGFPLEDATPAIMSWTVPADGQMHRVCVVGELVVTSQQTGGVINLVFSDPGGTLRTQPVWAGNLAAAFTKAAEGATFTVAPGQTVTLVQTAQTAGAATLWAELWGA